MALRRLQGERVARDQYGSGSLLKVDPRRYRDPGRSGGYELTNGDGLLVRGTTLYVVQNRLKQVAAFKINADGTSGELVDIPGSDDFDAATTVAAFGNSLCLPDARFGIPDPATAEYWITRIDRH
jgi:hypothetical protein